MKVQVRLRHIDRGQRGIATTCPVALALIEAGYHNPIVEPRMNAVLVSFEVLGYRVASSCWIDKSTDSNLYRQIATFDEQGVMEEFEFEMYADPEGNPA